MAGAPVPRQFEQIDLPDEVRLSVGARILERVAHAGLRAEVDDAVELGSVKRFAERAGIGEIDPFESERAAVFARQQVDPGLLEFRVVVGVKIVDPDDSVSAGEQGARDGKPDEARGAGDDDGHGERIAMLLTGGEGKIPVATNNSPPRWVGMQVPANDSAHPLARRFAIFIEREGFPCVGAKAAVNRGGMRDLVIGLTACSAPQSNNGSFKPIQWQVD